MSVLLFKLRNVPDDEADEVRELLTQNNIDYYETAAGAWGISLAAIWLHNDTKLEEAKALINAYQQDRQQRMRRLHEELKARGEHRTMLDMVKESPVKALLYLAALLFILYISTVPFIQLFK